MKKYVAMILATVMILSLCACHTNPLTGGKNINGLSPDEAVKQAMEQLQDADSFRMDAEVGFSLAAMGQTVKVGVQMSAEQTRAPEAMHLTMTMDAAYEIQEMEEYVVKDGDSYVAYAREQDGVWYKQTSTSDELVSNFRLDNITGYTEAGTETIGGELCTHYICVIPAEKLLETLGSLNAMQGVGLDLNNPDVLGHFGDLPIGVWIYRSSGRLARFSVDATTLIEGLYSSALQGDDLGIEVKNVIMQYDFSRYNEIAPIEVPADVIAQAN